MVLNPHALGVRRSPGLRARLEATLARAGVDGEVVETRDTGELEATARRFAAARVPLVATCGGDGTNLATVTALVRAYGEAPLPALAPLRGGTVNTVAENLGIRGRPAALLERLARRLGDGTLATQPQDLLCVRDGDSRRYGFLFAALMGARFLEAYYGGARQGLLAAGALAVRTAWSSLVRGRLARRLFAPEALALTLDGEPLPPTAYRLLVASVVRDVGIGMKVAWQAGRVPGRFHVVASGLTTTSMALQLPRVLSGRPLAGAPHLDRLATALDIAFTRPQVYTLDGELYRAATLAVEIGPRIEIARP